MEEGMTVREIKFRGKRIDNGEWVYGNLIGTDRIVGEIVEWDDEYFCTEFWYVVDPETVGQYTGLKDKFGVEIYEGDLLKCQLPVEIMDNSCHALDGETIIAKVVCEDGCFMAEGKTVEYPWVLDGDKTILAWLCKIKAYGRYQTTVEVIGNEFEHHHLLPKEDEPA